jgi:hypothetical protein
LTAGLCASNPCSNVIAAETFAQRWVDEKGQEVKLDMAERLEIAEILRMAPSRVLKVQRVYKEELEKRYATKRKKLRTHGNNQVFAFHSTGPQNVAPYLFAL